MRTLIIPCAGTRVVDGIPLFLNYYPDGNLVCVKAIEGAFFESYDRIVFTLLKETEEKYDAIAQIRKSLRGKDAEFVVLDKATNGPAETVYQTIKKAKVEGEFAVRDSHAFLKLKKDYVGNFVAGLDLTKYEKPIDNLRSKSFITINEQGQVLDIVEKHFSSDTISAGMYGFKSVEDYIFAYEHLCDPNYGIKKLYLSHVISYLIGYNQRVFHRAKVTEFEDWSTKSAWQKVQKAHSVVFVNMNEITSIEGLSTLRDGGVKLIGFSSKALIDPKLEMLFDYIINGCPQTKSKIIVDNDDELEKLLVEL